MSTRAAAAEQQEKQSLSVRISLPIDLSSHSGLVACLFGPEAKQLHAYRLVGQMIVLTVVP